MHYKHIFVLSIAVLFSIQSCRKGEDDPLISLRPRTDRLTGKWELKYLNGYFDFYDESDNKLFFCQCLLDYNLTKSMRYSKVYSDHGVYYLFEEYNSYFIFNEEGETDCRIKTKDYTYISDGNWQWNNEIGEKKEYLYISDLNIIIGELIDEVSDLGGSVYLPVRLEEFENINNFQLIRLSNNELVMQIKDEVLRVDSGDIKRVHVIFDLEFEKDKEYEE